MTRFLIAAFLIAHGLVHIGVYAGALGTSNPEPFDPRRSWLLAGAHVGATPMGTASLALGLAVAAAYAVAGWTVALDVDAWMGVAALAASLGLVLKGVWFNTWLVYGIALDVAVLAAVAVGWPPSLF
jgi:hypothetical protein